MSDDRRPLPVPDRDSAPFWEGCRRHELLLQRCTACSAWRFPPAPVCDWCRSREYRWEPHPGTGEVYSWVVVHHAVVEAFADATPYIVALVELEHGVRMPTNLVECDPGEIEAGMPVQVIFAEVTEGVTLPLFAPSGRAAADSMARTGEAHA